MRAASIALWGLALVGLIFILTSGSLDPMVKTLVAIAVALAGSIAAAILSVSPPRQGQGQGQD